MQAQQGNFSLQFSFARRMPTGRPCIVFLENVASSSTTALPEAPRALIQVSPAPRTEQVGRRISEYLHEEQSDPYNRLSLFICVHVCVCARECTCVKLKSDAGVFFTEVHCLLNAEPAKSVSAAEWFAWAQGSCDARLALGNFNSGFHAHTASTAHLPVPCLYR